MMLCAPQGRSPARKPLERGSSSGPERRLPRPVWVMLLLAFGLAACNDKALDKHTGPAASASAAGGLSPELASKVLAKVGDHEITLGEFASTLDRMDQFERLRYQSPDRRKQLLDEMIKVQLLAQEARRRGLDKKPGTRERIRQILRDEMLRQVRAGLPPPGEIPAKDLHDYYDAHRADFREPERRRVSHIVMKDGPKAAEVLKKAEKATPVEWGELVREYSLEATSRSVPTAPLEMAGDLGIVSPPGTGRGDNPRVPEALRAAVFKIDKVGDVYGELVKVGDKVHIVRMTAKTDPRDRTFKEAERTIRVTLAQQQIRDAQAKLDKQLRERFPVKVDDAALDKISTSRKDSPSGWRRWWHPAQVAHACPCPPRRSPPTGVGSCAMR